MLRKLLKRGREVLLREVKEQAEDRINKYVSAKSDQIAGKVAAAVQTTILDYSAFVTFLIAALLFIPSSFSPEYNQNRSWIFALSATSAICLNLSTAKGKNKS